MIGRVVELSDMGGFNKQQDAVAEAPVNTVEVLKAKRASRFNSEAMAIASLAGRRLRLVREMLELSRPMLASKLDIPPTTLKNYELGYRMMGAEMLVALTMVPDTQAHMMFVLTGKNPSGLLLEWIKANRSEAQIKDLGIVL